MEFVCQRIPQEAVTDAVRILYGATRSPPRRRYFHFQANAYATSDGYRDDRTRLYGPARRLFVSLCDANAAGAIRLVRDFDNQTRVIPEPDWNYYATINIRGGDYDRVEHYRSSGIVISVIREYSAINQRTIKTATVRSVQSDCLLISSINSNGNEDGWENRSSSYRQYVKSSARKLHRYPYGGLKPLGNTQTTTRHRTTSSITRYTMLTWRSAVSTAEL